MIKKVIAFLTMVTLGLILFTNTTTFAATHTVTKGETLYSIAKKYNTTITNIKNLNKLKTDSISINQKLEVPGAVTTTATSTTAAKATAAVATNSTYTVVKGDTLSKVASKHGVSVATLKSWNGLTSDNIKIGQKLSVKGAVTTVSRNDAEAAVVKTIRVTASAYTANCSGCSGVTATGINLKKNPSVKVIAVDPNVIPLGSKVWVEGYGYAVAADKGGSIRGNTIDVFYSSTSQALQWGRKTVTVKVLK